MKFLVIMPSLLADYPGAAVNRHKTIIRAIESVLAQSFQDFELIVIADGCELTRHIMKTKYDDNPKVKYGIINRTALFGNGARNTAIDIAEGEYIIYIDNDDKWGPDHLKIFNDQISGEDWVYADDWTVDQVLLRDSGAVSWIRRDTDVTQYGKCGTSNICHARRSDQVEGGRLWSRLSFHPAAFEVPESQAYRGGTVLCMPFSWRGQGMTIFIFGSSGMLGSYLSRYFDFSVRVDRSKVDAFVTDRKVLSRQLNDLHIESGDVIINAVGITNKCHAPDRVFLMVNSVFPRLLADYCEEKSAHMIHITTDCVFDGEFGSYKEDDIANAKDFYGLSKSLGEPLNCTVIRTSVIGENSRSKSDLLEWVRSNQGSEIRGYTDHYWNGITCLQYAKVCDMIIQDKLFWKGVRHIFSPAALSKFMLVKLINDTYGMGCTVTPVESGKHCDRTLSTWHPMEFDIPAIEEQVVEQRSFRLRQ